MSVRLIPTVTATLPRKRDFNRITNVCNRLWGLEVRDQLPEHFEPNAQQRFRYKRRTKKYEAKKQRLFGHTTPLVFTGELKRAVLRSAKVEATAKHGTVTARGSRGTKEQKGSNLRQQYRNEIETITRKQEREFARNYDRNFDELANLPEFQSTSGA